MDPITLLMIAGLAVGSIASAKSFYDLYEKMRALRKLKKNIRSNNRAHVRQLENLAKELQENPSNMGAIQDAQEIIEESLASLSKTERKKVAQGLYQPSNEGKGNYVANLLEESTKRRKVSI